MNSFHLTSYISHFRLHGAGAWFSVRLVRTCSQCLVYVDPHELTARGKVASLGFFCSSLSLFLISLRCQPPLRVSPCTFLPVWPHFSTILCKFTHTFFFIRVSSPGGGSPPSPSLVTPLLGLYYLTQSTPAMPATPASYSKGTAAGRQCRHCFPSVLMPASKVIGFGVYVKNC